MVIRPEKAVYRFLLTPKNLDKFYTLLYLESFVQGTAICSMSLIPLVLNGFVSDIHPLPDKLSEGQVYTPKSLEQKTR